MTKVMAKDFEPPSHEVKENLFAVLAQRFGSRFSTGTSLREQHGHTLTWIRNEPPDAVLFATAS
jgi:D-lactate dehydrogenase (cytochrome)